MKISIITATYNREKTIARSIDSLYSQTYQNYEHIIVDGASTDNTLAIIKKTVREGTIIVSESDNGIYDAFNKGITLCRGDVIGFLHSDDIYYDNYTLEKIHKKFVALPNVQGLFGNSIFKKDINSRIHRFYRSPQVTEENMSRGLMPSHTSLYLKHDVYRDKGHFDTRYKIAGDFEFLCRLVKDPGIILYNTGDIITSMLSGGASTSLANKITLNKEILLACRKNKIDSSWSKILGRYPAKFWNEVLILQNPFKTIE